MASNPLYVPRGGRVPFDRTERNIGIIATDNDDLIEELRRAAKRRIGGVLEITQDEYLKLKYPYSDAKHPERSVPPPMVNSHPHEVGIDQLYVKWKLAKGRFKPPERTKEANRPRIIHVVERHVQRTPDDERRVRNAFDSWFRLYRTGLVVPCHLWDYPRTAKSIGDARDLPYLKDVLLAGMNKAREQDIVMLTNDDGILQSEIADVILSEMATKDAICSFRLNFPRDRVPPANTPIKELQLHGDPCLGRDLFAFRKTWLRDHWHSIPDFILGELEWDLVMAVMVRRSAGIITTKSNITEVMPECELPRGYVIHEIHNRLWTDDKLQRAPAKLWNMRLMAEWHADNGFENLISKIL